MTLADIFNDDAFGVVSMTTAINKMIRKPGRLGELGIFTTEGVTTTSVAMEEREGLLALLSTVRRGGPANVAKKGKRTARTLAVPHIPLESSISADEVQNVRAFGTENQTEVVAQVVNNHLARLRDSHEATLEYHRAGAIQGKVLDADGATVLYDLFTTFGVTEQSVNFDLSNDDADIRNKCVEAARKVEDALGAATYSSLHGFCGSTFFDALISHPDVKEAYSRWQNGEALRNDARRGFQLGGIMFEEYRHKVSGVDYLPATECRIIPLGVPEFLMTFYAPADFVETVNTIGLPIYAKQELQRFGKGIDIHTQSNPLNVCTRPAALVKATMTAGS